MSISKNQQQIAKRLFLIIIGSFILGLGSGLFLIPYGIVTGGVSGMAIVCSSLIGLTEEVWVTIFTWVFFLLGWIILGTKFAAKTVLSTIIYPLAVFLGTYLNTNTIFNLGTISEINNSFYILLAGVFGGILVGTGVGLTFLGGGSTGGVDVITLSFQKFLGFKASHVSFIVDAIIVFLGFILIEENDFGLTLNGIISAYIASFMIGRLFDTEKNMVVNIISKKNDEINRIVTQELDRGSTIISGIGGYTLEEVSILEVVLDIREYYVLMDIIAKVDPTSFVTVTKLSAVKGEGFKSHQTKKIIGKRND